MFDEITEVPEQKCQGCGAVLGGWQSKDGPCECTEVAFWRVSNFYTSCAKCGMWHDFSLKTEPTPRPLSDYQLSIRPNGTAWDQLIKVTRS